MHVIQDLWNHFWWWFLHATGADNPSGVEYGWWSGSGSDIGELTIIAAVFTLGKAHFNCHEPGCWRIAKHHYTDSNGVRHLLCWRHHPFVPDKGTSIAAHVAADAAKQADNAAV